MARSNQGGTRGFLRGRVANDLYQVTHRADGRKVQLVRAVEESRVNNNTLEQALARMRMALLMGALADLKQIVDHSWQGIPYGQLSIAHFVRVNMPLVTADCKEHWATNNQFCYPVKGVKEIRIGAFKIASGSLSAPAAITRGDGYIAARMFPFTIHIEKEDPTFGDLKAALGLNALDYITLLASTGLDLASQGILNQSFIWLRLYLAENIPDETLITEENVKTMFTWEGNTNFTMEVDAVEGLIKVLVDCSPDGLPREAIASSVIVSHWDGRVWCRNNASFMPHSDTTAFNFEYNSAHEVFKSWYEPYDPDGEDSGEYPGKK